MSHYYMRTPDISRARRQMWDHFMNANVNEEQAKVVFPIDVRVDENGYLISAFLPGVNTEDLDIQVVNNTVTIKGEIKLDRNEGEHYLIAERPSGRFYRSIELPDDLDSEKAEADLKNGVLKLNVPKSEMSRPRKIKISNN
ncbi:MAG: Hsp20/alpha crystallin family protein [Anaerolineaceae bacterium]|nr:Hsp20/alpha crystallin family protein [Anaerolineaceae bacterium]